MAAKLTQEEKYMKAAIREAKKAWALGEVPIGCVIVYEDKIIGIAAVRHRGFPLPVFSDRRTSAPLDTVIPVPPIFSGFPAQVALMQVLIELIQHDVR